MNNINNLTLVIPAKEEPQSLPGVLKELSKYECKKIIVLKNDDIETINAIKNYDVEIVYQTKKGYGNAIIEGIQKVNTRFLAIYYADGSTDPKYLMPMLNLIKINNYSIVFGSRYEKNAGSLDDDFITRIGNFFFTTFGNIFFNLKITDILFTYIVCVKSDINKLKLESNNYNLCVEIPLKSKVKNLKYCSYPCIERKRIGDQKKVKPFKVGFQILTYMLKFFFLNIINTK